MNGECMRAAGLLKLAPPFEVKFAGGWKKIARVEDNKGFAKPDLPRVGLYDDANRLVSWFYYTTEVRVRFLCPECGGVLIGGPAGECEKGKEHKK